MKKLPYIDSLRGIAVLGVLLVHVNQHVEGLPSWLDAIAKQGARGVQLFFIVSAFTLFLSMQQRRQESRPLVNFFIRRFFRIAPLFYTAIAFYAIQQAIAEPETFSVPQLLSVLTFTNSWNPFWVNGLVPGCWSISVEVMFYGVVPLLFQKIRNLQQSVGFTSLMLVMSLMTFPIMRKLDWIVDEAVREEFLFYWLPNQVAIFGLGFMLYFIVFQSGWVKGVQSSENPHLSQQAPASLLLAIALFLIVILPFGSYVYLPRHFMYGVAFVMLATALAMYPFRWLVNPFWCYLGRISFSAYLSHFVVLAAADAGLKAGLAALPFGMPAIAQLFLLLSLTLVGTCLISEVTFRWIEVPGQRLGKSIIGSSLAPSP
ncbi:MAG: acyltransferase [Oculatellaceae cyanobacterium Prado106]|jgi:peptidoglycan/LPS O-acetylase OafA/YrhL|nr:acyltransferase [Oculatellaceae cyanobacterium Prado106]